MKYRIKNSYFSSPQIPSYDIYYGIFRIGFEININNVEDSINQHKEYIRLKKKFKGYKFMWNTNECRGKISYRGSYIYVHYMQIGKVNTLSTDEILFKIGNIDDKIACNDKKVKKILGKVNK